MRRAISSAGVFRVERVDAIVHRGVRHSQPAQPSAADLAELKTKCGEDGVEFGGGGDQFVAHFNEQTRQCYLEQIALLNRRKN